MSKTSKKPGDKIGRLTLIELQSFKDPKGRNIYKWLCECDCGTKKWIYSSNLKEGKTISCGCFTIERNKARKSDLIDKHPRLYRIHRSMKNRCNNKNDFAYNNYGGRGITVCDEWNNSEGFENFVAWALSHGYQDELTIERINNDKGYCPNNCKWATYTEQAHNKRNTRNYTYNNITMPLSCWEKKLGFKRNYLYSRIAGGMSFEQAISTPIRFTRLPIIHDTDNEIVKHNKSNYIKFITMFNDDIPVSKIATMINVNQNDLHDWKKGKSKPNKEHMKLITDYLGVSSDYFN